MEYPPVTVINGVLSDNVHQHHPSLVIYACLMRKCTDSSQRVLGSLSKDQIIRNLQQMEADIASLRQQVLRGDFDNYQWQDQLSLVQRLGRFDMNQFDMEYGDDLLPGENELNRREKQDVERRLQRRKRKIDKRDWSCPCWVNGKVCGVKLDTERAILEPLLFCKTRRKNKHLDRWVCPECFKKQRSLKPTFL